MRTIHCLITAVILVLTSCAGIKDIPFSTGRFHMDANTGYIQNVDSTLRFTFCSKVIEPDMLIIDNENQAARYRELHKYLNNICSQLNVNCDSILFYTPSNGKMFVEISEPNAWKPRSQTTNMAEDDPYTAWVRDDDAEQWIRQPDELYSNVLLNKRKKQILVIDRFNYGKKRVALIHIIQSPTKQFLKIGLPQWTETWADVTDPTCLEPISNWIDGHRKIAIENYRLGLLPK